MSLFREGDGALTVLFIHILTHPYLSFNIYIFIAATLICSSNLLADLYVQIAP